MWRVVRVVLRALAWLILGAVLLVLVAATTLVLWARSRAGRELLKSTITSALQQRVNGRVTIAALEGNLTRRCVLRDVRIYDRERRLAVALPQIRLEYSLAAVVRRTIRIRSVDADGTVQARIDHDGQLNLVTLLRSPRPSGGGRGGRSWNVAIGAARARIAFVADGVTGTPALRGRLVLEGAADARAGEVDVEVTRLHAVIDTPTQATLDASGEMRWSDGGPSFRDLQARLQSDGAPLRLASGVEIHVPLEALLRGQGRELTAIVTMPRSDLRAEARAEIGRDARVRWTATARATSLDPAAIFPAAPHGRIALAARGWGEGRAMSVAVDQLQLDVASAHASANGRVALGRGLYVDARADVRAPDLARVAGPFGIDLRGSLSADLHVRRTASANAIDATARARGLALGRVRAAALDGHVHMSNLVGHATFGVRDAELAVGADPSMSARLPFATLRLDGDGRTLAIAFDGTAADGSHLGLHGRGVPLPGGGRYAVAVSIRQLALGREARWQLTGPGELLLGRHAVAARVSLAAGTRSLVVDVALRGAPARVDGHLYARHLDLGALARSLLPESHVPATELDLDARVEGDVARGSARLAASTGDDEHVRMRGGWFRRTDGAHRLDGALVASGVLVTHLRPLLPGPLRASSGRASLHARLAGTTTDPALTAHVGLRPWRIDGRVAYRAAIDVAYHHARLAVRLDADALEPQRGHVWLNAELPIAVTAANGRIRAQWATVAPLALTLRAQQLALTGLPQRALGITTPIRSGAADVAIDVRGTISAPAAGVHLDVRDVALAKLDGLGVTLDGALDPRHAKAVLHATIGGAPLVDARAESTVDLRELADARTRGRTALSLRATATAHDLSPLPGLGGSVDARAELTGTLARPRLWAALHARELRASQMRFTEVDAEGVWDADTLDAALHAREASGGALELAGRLPRRADEPMEARLQLRQLKIAVDRVGALQQVEATVDADVRLGGPRRAPFGSGFVKVAHGAFTVGATSPRYHDLTLDVALAPGALELRQLAVAADGGKLAAHGRIALDGLRPRSVALVAEADRFPFLPANAEAWLDARLELRGRGDGDRFDGEITVSRGHAELPSLDRGPELQPTGPLEDVVFVDEPGGARAPAIGHHLVQEARALDVTVLARIPGPFRVESQDLRADLQGELEVRAVGGAIGVYGEAEATSGRIELLNRPYEIERARVSFDGGLDPHVDVRLTREVTNAKLVIALHGTVEHPELELTSDPPIYNPSQIVGLVIAGDPEHQRIDARSSNEELVGALSGILVGRILEQVAPGLPIDVIRLESASPTNLASFENARLEIGKYIRENIYVSYVHRFGSTMENVHRNNSHEANVDFRFRRRFSLGMRFGDAGIGALDLTWSLGF